MRRSGDLRTMSPLKKGKLYAAKKLMRSHPALDTELTNKKQKKSKLKVWLVFINFASAQHYILYCLNYAYVYVTIEWMNEIIESISLLWYLQTPDQGVGSNSLKTLKSIKDLQKSTRLLIPKAAFGRVVREVLKAYAGQDLRYI